MKRLLLLAAVPLACRVYPAPDATHFYACASDSDCTSSASGVCTDGFCVYGGESPDGRDAGSSVCSCDAGQVCFEGSCQASCAGALNCNSLTECDVATQVCVPLDSCVPNPNKCPNGENCETASNVDVCVPSSMASQQLVSCGPPNDNDGGSNLVSGLLALFPGRNSTNLSNLKLEITFIGEGDAGLVQATWNGGTGYSADVPPGRWIALVTGDGLLPTFFPDLQISQLGSSTLDLLAIVPNTVPGQEIVAFDAGLIPGRWTWVGELADCNGNSLGGYTVGIAPAPDFLGYCNNLRSGSLCLSDPPETSAARINFGEFIALNVPEDDTRYAIDYGNTAVRAGVAHEIGNAGLLPSVDGGAAVALIFPYWNQPTD